MEKVKVFAKTEVDLVHKVGVYAYCLYDFRAQLSDAKSFKKGIKTMTHADCMAFVNALHILSLTAAAGEVEELEIITDSSKVAKLIEQYVGEKHCEAAAAYWKDTIKPKFKNLKLITIVKTDRKGTGPADNIYILKKLGGLAQYELGKLKELAA